MNRTAIMYGLVSGQQLHYAVVNFESKPFYADCYENNWRWSGDYV